MKNQTLLNSDKKFDLTPKFRHNLWTTFQENPEITYLTVSHSKFEVPTSDARKFLKIRSHCTGYNTVEEIAKRSGVSSKEVEEIIQPLIDNEILHLPIQSFDSLNEQDIQEMLVAACRIWSEQLSENHLINEISEGLVSKAVVIGWLLETYHYIKAFPSAIEHAAKYAEGELQKSLQQYASEEQGHEEFVLNTLISLGFSRNEVEDSIPLVSTRSIDLLMCELFELFPAAAFLVAAIVEVENLEQDELLKFREKLAMNYEIEVDTFMPIQEHMLIDESLGHANLLQKHLSTIKFEKIEDLHAVVNSLHDIKHAFDLQKLEIKSYYSQVGNYIPRQFVDYFAI